MTSSPQKLGFIGLGIMGAPMALHLIKAGHALFVHTRSKLHPQIAESSATQCSSAKDVAERADVIFTMLPDTPDVEAVALGPGGLIEGIRPGTFYADMSTIAPSAVRQISVVLSSRSAES